MPKDDCFFLFLVQIKTIIFAVPNPSHTYFSILHNPHFLLPIPWPWLLKRWFPSARVHLLFKCFPYQISTASLIDSVLQFPNFCHLNSSYILNFSALPTECTTLTLMFSNPSLLLETLFLWFFIGWLGSDFQCPLSNFEYQVLRLTIHKYLFDLIISCYCFWCFPFPFLKWRFSSYKCRCHF